MTRTEATLEQARKLVKLLEDPHEGLFTWNDAVTALLTQLGEMVDDPYPYR